MFSNDSLIKRKTPEISQTTNPNNNEGHAEAKKAKLSPDDESPAKICWKKRDRVPFMFMAEALDAISNESDTIARTEILCSMLRTVIETTPGELVAVVYLLSESILPPDQDTDFVSVHNEVHMTIAEACEALGDADGDLGLVAEQENPLTVVKVLETFRKLTKTYIAKEDKNKLIKELFSTATGCELLYLSRLLQRMLQGGSQLLLTEQTLLTALGHAALYSGILYSHPANIVYDKRELEEAAKAVKEVYSKIPVYDKLVPDLLLGGVLELRETCTITPGIPFRAMLPKQTIRLSELSNKFQDKEFICEFEYPGERSLIHYKENGQVEIYNTYGGRTTQNYPVVPRDVLGLTRATVSSFILDCYLVMGFPKEKEIQSSKVCIYASDILYLNGEVLLQEQLSVRIERLHGSFYEQHGVFQFAAVSTSIDLQAIKIFLDEAVKSGCPRLILKTLTKDSTYELGKISENWLELEKDYLENIHPSLDLVPIAALRDPDMSVDICTFLLACYDSDKDEFQTIGTVGREIPEAVLRERLHSLRSKVIYKPKPNYKYPKTMRPAVWFEPTEVWEVQGESLCVSCSHPAAFGTVDATKGIMLRRPNSVRVLPGKDPKQASSPDKAVQFYQASKSYKGIEN